MKYSLYSILISFFALSVLGRTIPRAKVSYLQVESVFKRNKKIWGTYRQVSETIGLKTRAGLTKKRSYKKIGDVIVKDNKIFVIRSIRNKNATEILVENFPYQKKRSNTYSVHTSRIQKLSKLYQSDIKKYLLKSKALRNYTKHSFHNFKCQRQRSLFKCSFDVKVYY